MVICLAEAGSVQAKYFRISAVILELRMLIFFRSEKKRVNESAIRLSGTYLGRVPIDYEEWSLDPFFRCFF